MNHREPPQVPQGMRRAGHFLSLLLVAAAQGLGLVSAHAGTLFPPSGTASSAPCGGYLPARGAPPLRFAAIIVPATPLAAVSAAKPAPGPTPPAGVPNRPGDQPASADVSLRPPAPEAAAAGSTPGKSAPLPILPDEARPQVQPEDFLPYFRIPGTGRNPDVTVVMPAPTSQPNPPPQTSSATYTQTDK